MIFLTRVLDRAARFLRDTSGATAIEYVLIMIIVSTAIILSIDEIGTHVSAPFTSAGSGIGS